MKIDTIKVFFLKKSELKLTINSDHKLDRDSRVGFYNYGFKYGPVEFTTKTEMFESGD